MVEIISLTPEYKNYITRRHNTVMYSSPRPLLSSGLPMSELDKKPWRIKTDEVVFSLDCKPLSRVELYQSGANRIIRESHFGGTPDPNLRKKDDIREFSPGARRRYFFYVNSLDLTSMKSIFFATFTISSHLDQFLNKEVFTNAVNSLFKKLHSQGFDFVYKVEYTLGCSRQKSLQCKKNCIEHRPEKTIICQYNEARTPIPHLHILLYSKRLYGFKNRHDRIRKAREFSAFWTDSVLTASGLSLARFFSDDIKQIDEHMSHVSCELQKPRDLIKLIYYFTDYTGKSTKEAYQNECPEKYLGTRFWGKRRKNYKNLTVSPVYIGISENIYNEIYFSVAMRWREIKEKKCRKAGRSCDTCNVSDKCQLYRKNGLYHPAPLAVLNELIQSGKFQKQIHEPEFLNYIEKKLYEKHQSQMEKNI